MPSFTVGDMPSNLTQYTYPHRKKVGRKGRHFRRKAQPHILNRPAFTYPIGRRFTTVRHTNRSIELIESTQEMRWLAEHGHEYAGQWVALDGGRLLSHGENARDVYDAARRSGVNLPLVVRVDSGEQLPFGGW